MMKIIILGANLALFGGNNEAIQYVLLSPHKKIFHVYQLSPPPSLVINIVGGESSL